MCGMALERSPTAAAATKWTCPMHPEVVRSEPGPCPICGMALEPMEPTADEEDNAELRDMSRRFWFATGFTVPHLISAMGDMLPGEPLSQLLSPRVRTMA